MAASTWTWKGLTNSINTSTNWTLTSGPGNANNRPKPGDTAIFGGAGVAPLFYDDSLSGGFTLDLSNNGSLQFSYDTTLLSTTSIDSTVTIGATGTAAAILTEGTFTNGGTIQVTGSGNALSISVTPDGTLAGWFENDGSIAVDTGDSLTITATAGATYAGYGTLFVEGGSALIDAGLSQNSGDDNFSISQSGSLEIENAGSSPQPDITFNGNGFLKLDQPNKFAGTISDFVLGDTIDLGIVNVASVVYNSSNEIFLLAANGATIFAAQASGGVLGGDVSSNGSVTATATFSLSGTGGVAGDVIVTEGNGDTVLTATPPRTWLWNGASAQANTAADWSVLSGSAYPGGYPSQGDTAIVPSGTLLGGNQFNLKSNTLELGGTAGVATLQIGGVSNGGTGTSSIDSASTITNAIAADTSAEQSLLSVIGTAFDNQGSIIANGPSGSSFTIAVSDTTSSGSIEPGYFINYNKIEVGPSNTATITAGADSEFFNASLIEVIGGYLLFQGSAGAFNGGYAGGDGAIEIAGGGTVETNAAYLSSSVSGGPVYAFGDSTSGNTLKIDNIGSFGGVIIGFGTGDTIDLGTLISGATVAYSATTGILNVKKSGSIVASLVLGSGNFTGASFTVGTGTDGDTILTTAVQNDTYINTSGSWQATGAWTNGTPGSLDTGLIGLSASNFTLTTGSSTVTAGAPILAGGLLQITSNTTFDDYPIRDFGGSLEVTSNNTLTATQLYTTGGDTQIDPGGTLVLTGHAVYGTTGAVNGTVTASTINARALYLGGGSMLVDGGVINAGTGQSGGNGGAVYIGVDGGGTPVTLTVENSGSTDGVVTDTYTTVGSDPTGYGDLILNGGGVTGGVTWTDQIDPTESATNTTGYMNVGYNNQSSITGTVTPPAIAGTATVEVENAATLTDQSYALIGSSPDGAGSVDVNDGLWNIGTGPSGGFLTVGDSADSVGYLSVENAGTVSVANGGTFELSGTSFTGSAINVGQSSASAGTITVSSSGVINDLAALQAGVAGQGFVLITNGGTVNMTGTNGVTTGVSATGSGTLEVSGTDGTLASILTIGTKGITDGGSGQGTVDVESGGTIQMNGSGGLSVGSSASATGILIVEGAGALITQGSTGNGIGIAAGVNSTGSVLVQNGGSILLNASGINIGQTTNAHGTLDIESGGTVQANGSGNIAAGSSAGATGLIIVNGSGAALNAGTLVANTVTGSSTGLAIGNTGSGTLDITNGGTLQFDSNSGGLRVGSSGSGTVLVSGSGSSLILNTPNNPNNVGNGGAGTLTVSAGGSVTTDSSLGIGSVGTASAGTVTVTGSGSAITVNGTNGASVSVGGPGSGALTVTSGGLLTAANGIFIATSSSSSTGTVSVTGSGSAIDVTGGNGITVGDAGAGSLSIGSGATVTDAASFNLGSGSVGSTGTVTVSGSNSALNLTGFNGSLTVGAPGSGSLNISAGGMVSAAAGIFIASFSSAATGTITVTGGTLSDGGGMTVGNSGKGTLSIGTAGQVTLSGGNINVGGFQSGASGYVAINGGTLSDTGGVFIVGNSGAPGTVTIGAAGSLTVSSVNDNSGGTINVAGTGATLTASTGLNIGGGSTGAATLTIGGGGVVANTSSTVGVSIGSGNSSESGAVTVNSGGTLTTGQLTLGSGGTGTLTVNAGGTVTATGTSGVSMGGFGIGGSGSLTINGGALTDDGSFSAGNTNSSGTLLVEGGGSLYTTSSGFGFAGLISASGTGTAAATVSGGTWTANGQLSIGGSGSGKLDINTGGLVNAGTNSVNVGGTAGSATLSLESNGSLNAGFIAIDNGPSFGATAQFSVAGGTVTATTVSESQGGTITVSSGSLSAASGMTIGGSGTGAQFTLSGGAVSAGSFSIAQNVTSTGTAAVTGGVLTTTGATVGSGGAGLLTISSGGQVTNSGTSSFNIGGFTAGASGTVTVGTGGTLSSTGGYFGVGGSNSVGILTVDGALITGGTTAFADISGQGTGMAAATVGGGGVWTSNGQIIVGDSGTGSLDINGSGVVNAGTNSVTIGQQGTGSGRISLESGGSLQAGAISIDNSSSLTAAGTLALAGGTVTVATLSESAGGVITVAGGSLGVSGTGAIGQAGTGAALTQSGGTASFGNLVLGQNTGSSGTATVSGGTLTASGSVTVGNSGLGSFSVTNGVVNALSGLEIGAAAGADGSSANVTGGASKVTVTGALQVGMFTSSALQISDGATVTASTLDAANATSSVANIVLTGTGTDLAVIGSATVADSGTGELSILSGAVFSAASLTIGSLAGGTGAVIVSGTGSQLNLTGALNIGTSSGNGDLVIGAGATVNASVINLNGQVVLEGGLLDPTVQVVGQNQTIGGYGTLLAGDIVDEGTVQAGGSKPSQHLLVVDGTLVGGALSVNGTAQPSATGDLLIDAGGTMELTGAVLNSATATFTDELTPANTYAVSDSVVDVTFADQTGVLRLDDIAGFGGTIATWQAGDQFVVTGGTLSDLGVSNGNTLTMADSGSAAGAGGIDSIIFGSTVNAADFTLLNGNTIVAGVTSSAAVVTNVGTCFAEGTRIWTDAGPVPIEDLETGDLIVTSGDTPPEPVVWIGHRKVDCARHPEPGAVWPVRVRAGAFGPGLPVRDLYLSPDHAIFVNGVLVPVKLLIDGAAIAQVKRRAVTYYHVELPRHAVILAEGLPVESYLDLGDRADFREGGDAIRLFPDFAARLAPSTAAVWETRGAAKLVIAGQELAAARAAVSQTRSLIRSNG